MGPSRRGRDRLLPQGPAVRGTRRDGRDPRHARGAGPRGGARLNLLAVLLAIGGALLGLASDRLAVRWPEHDDEHPPGRPIGWRTVACAGFGAFAFGLLGARFDPAADPVAFVAFGAWFATLVVGFATDLDQRLLPDELTLPVIPIALILDVAGRNPLVGTEIGPAVAIAIIVPLGLFLASIPFGEGAFGLGDVKLLIGVGLMSGFFRTFNGLLAGLLASGIVLALLLLTRRIGRRA